MRILFKAVRTAGEFVALLNHAKSQGIGVFRRRRHYWLTADMLSDYVPESRSVSINWGGYGSGLTMDEGLYGWIALGAPADQEDRKAPFRHVVAIFNGEVADAVVEEFHRLGGVSAPGLAANVNLMVTGPGADEALTQAALDAGAVLVIDGDRYQTCRPRKPKRRDRTEQFAGLSKEQVKTVKGMEKALKEVFKGRDHQGIAEAVDGLLADCDGQLLDALLHGTAWSETASEDDGSGGGGATKDDDGVLSVEGSLGRSPLFTGTGPAQPYLDAALFRLLAGAPDDSDVAAELRENVTGLVLSATEMVDLSCLSAFPNLRVLGVGPYVPPSRIVSPIALSGIDTLGRLSLQALSLDRCSLERVDALPVDDLDELVSLALVSCPLADISGLEGMAALEQVHLSAAGSVHGPAQWPQSAAGGQTLPALTDLSPLAAMTALTDLHLARFKVDSVPLSEMTALESVRLGHFVNLTTLHITGLQGLAKVSVAASWDLDDVVVTDNPSLEELTLEAAYAPRTLKPETEGQETRVSVMTLANLPALARCQLAMAPERLTLADLPALETLEIDMRRMGGDPGTSLALTDVPALATVRVRSKLTGIELQNTPGLQTLALSHLDGALDLPTLEALEALSLALTTERLTLPAQPSLTRLDVVGPALTTLTLGAMPALTRATLGSSHGTNVLETIRFEAPLPALERMEVTGAMVGLGSWSSMPSLVSLELLSTKLTTLDGLACAPALKTLNLSCCGALVDVFTLLELPELDKVVLSSCDEVRPVPPKKTLDRSAMETYRAKLERAKERGKKTPGPAKPAKAPTRRTLIAGLRKALKGGRLDAVRQALAAIERAAMPEVVEGLLEGVELCDVSSPDELGLLRGVGVHKSRVSGLGARPWDGTPMAWSVDRESDGARVLVLNKVFDGTRAIQPLYDWALQGLLALAWDGCPTALALRESITGLRVANTPAGEMVDLSVFPRLRSLSVGRSLVRRDSKVDGLTDLGGLANATGLRALRLLAQKQLTSLKGLEILDLEHLELTGCTEVGNVSALSTQGGLLRLRIDNERYLQSTALTDLSSLADIDGLQELVVTGCGGFPSLPPLKGHGSLETVTLESCEGLQSLSGLTGCPSLKKLSVTQCGGLTSLEGLRDLPTLGEAIFDSNQGLKTVGEMGDLPALHTLSLCFTAALESLSGCSALPSLERLSLRYSGISTLVGLEGLARLGSLNLDKCDRLTSLEGLGEQPVLRHLNADSCAGLTSLSGLEGAPSLQRLSLRNGESLSDVSAIAGAEGLEHLDLCETATLGDLSPLANLTALQSLMVDVSAVKDLAPLAACHELWSLALTGAQIPDLTPLAALVGITDLTLRSMKVGDLAPLAALTDLKSLRCQGSVKRRAERLKSALPNLNVW